jgi:hypothetical protein
LRSICFFSHEACLEEKEQSLYGSESASVQFLDHCFYTIKSRSIWSVVFDVVEEGRRCALGDEQLVGEKECMPGEVSVDSKLFPSQC